MRRLFFVFAAALLVPAIACCGEVVTSAPFVSLDAGGVRDGSIHDAPVGKPNDSATSLDVTTAAETSTDASVRGDASGSTDAPSAVEGSARRDASKSLDAPVSVDAPSVGPDARKDAEPACLDECVFAGTYCQFLGPCLDAGPLTACPQQARSACESSCIDMCTVGQMQCNRFAEPCTDGGPVTTCVEDTLSTCEMGDGGCTVWGVATACSAGAACCSCYSTLCDAGGHSYDCTVCPAAPLGASCMQDSDCGSNACDGITLKCVDDPCDDDRQDGTETDVDCGGGVCQACSTGAHCMDDFDCMSGHPCLAPTHVCE